MCVCVCVNCVVGEGKKGLQDLSNNSGSSSGRGARLKQKRLGRDSQVCDPEGSTFLSGVCVGGGVHTCQIIFGGREREVMLPNSLGVSGMGRLGYAAWGWEKLKYHMAGRLSQFDERG